MRWTPVAIVGLAGCIPFSTGLVGGVLLGDTGDTGGTGDSGEPVPQVRLPAPVLSGLLITDNPHNVLACTVTWTTDLPSDTQVTVEGDGAPFTFSDPALVTDHEVLVIGLHAEVLHTLAVSSSTPSGGRVSVATTYAARPLPAHIPVGVVGARDDARMQPGWTLANVSNRDAGWSPTAVMYDAGGQPVWYHANGPGVDLRGDVHVSLVAGPHVLFGPSGAEVGAVEVDLAGEQVWEGPWAPGPRFYHHQLQRMSDGTSLALRKVVDGNLKTDGLRLFDADLVVVWSWDLRDHLVPPPGANGDWSHCNSATEGIDADELIVSCRNRDLVMGVSRTTGEILWKLGENGDFAPDPDAAVPFTHHQHAPEIQPNGNILMYDNRGLPGSHARVVEYALDHEALTSEIVWEFPGEFAVDPWYTDAWNTPIWGDADRQPNGNTLVTAGTRSNGAQTRIFEVTAAGEVVWELMLPAEQAGRVGAYRADRITPPLLDPPG